MNSNRKAPVKKKAKTFECTECDKVYCSASGLKLHITSHEDIKAFPCTICPKRFKALPYLKLHLLRHNTERNHKCQSCQMSFKTRIDLNQHFKVHLFERNFQCDYCGFSFKRKGDLLKHMNVHVLNRPFKCEQCGKDYKRKNDLSTHVYRCHNPNGKRYECPICLKRFMAKVCCTSHVKTHDINRPFKCEQCGAQFRTKKVLEQHKNSPRIHNVVVNPECDYCGKQFKTYTAIYQHVITHSKYKPYSCNVCSREYMKNWHLVAHMKKHQDVWYI